MADSITTIHGRMLADINDGYDKGKGEFLYDLTMPTAIEAERLDTKSDTLLDQGFADTCTGENLDRKCAERDIYRRQATYANGTVTVTGAAGAAIVRGELVASDTVHFAFAVNAILPASGTLDVQVSCQTAGAAGNVPAGAVKSFPKTLAGLRTVTNAAAFTNGYDEEDDDSLRERYYVKVRTPATSGNVWHYLGWAKEVAGVGDARVFPLQYGAGTVGVTIIDSNKRGADSTLVALVAAHIEVERPIGAAVTVESAAELAVAVAVTVLLDDESDADAVRDSIEEALTVYLREIAFVENYVSYAKIGNAILACPGVLDYSDLTINDDTANISVPDRSVAVLGGVTVG